MTVLSAEEQEYVARVRDLAVTHLLPLVEQGVEGRVNRPLLAAMGEHGLLRGHVLWGLASEVLTGRLVRLRVVRVSAIVYNRHAITVPSGVRAVRAERSRTPYKIDTPAHRHDPAAARSGGSQGASWTRPRRRWR